MSLRRARESQVRDWRMLSNAKGARQRHRVPGKATGYV